MEEKRALEGIVDLFFTFDRKILTKHATLVKPKSQNPKFIKIKAYLSFFEDTL